MDTTTGGTVSNWDAERRRRQERDDAFMAQLRAEHRHERRVALAGGVVGLVLTLALTLSAIAVWGSTAAVTAAAAGIGIVTALASIWGAHKIDEWRTQAVTDEPTATGPASDGTRWRVQGFLLPAVTGQDKDIPYAPIFLDSEQAAREKFTRLYRDHGPGMVRVEIEQLDADQ